MEGKIGFYNVIYSEKRCDYYSSLYDIKQNLK